MDAFEQDNTRILRERGFTSIRGREYFDASALPHVLSVVDSYAKLRNFPIGFPFPSTSHLCHTGLISKTGAQVRTTPYGTRARNAGNGPESTGQES